MDSVFAELGISGHANHETNLLLFSSYCSYFATMAGKLIFMFLRTIYWAYGDLEFSTGHHNSDTHLDRIGDGGCDGPISIRYLCLTSRFMDCCGGLSPRPRPEICWVWLIGFPPGICSRNLRWRRFERGQVMYSPCWKIGILGTTKVISYPSNALMTIVGLPYSTYGFPPWGYALVHGNGYVGTSIPVRPI